jgi:hypothetical protein
MTDAANMSKYNGDELIENESVSEATDSAARNGDLWVNPLTHAIVEGGKKADANAKLRHYFTDIDAAIEAWGAYKGDAAVIRRAKAVLETLAADLGTTFTEYYYLKKSGYMVAASSHSNHAGVAWMHKGQINHKIRIEGSLSMDAAAGEYYTSPLHSMGSAKAAIKETAAPAIKMCQKHFYFLESDGTCPGCSAEG